MSNRKKLLSQLSYTDNSASTPHAKRLCLWMKARYECVSKNVHRLLFRRFSLHTERLALLAPQLLKSAAILVTFTVALGTSSVVAQQTTNSQTSTLSQNYNTSDLFNFNQFNQHGVLSTINLVIVSSLDTGSFQVINQSASSSRVRLPTDNLIITDDQ